MKKYEVIWSGPAIRDLLEIIDYLKKESMNPEIAKRFGDEIINKTDQLQTMPFRGRVVPEFQNTNIREIFFKKRRIIYRIIENTVEILAVRHEARLLDETN